MEKIIGIVLPPDLKKELVAFGARHGIEVVEPHITLISNSMLRDAKSVDRNLQSFCLSQPPFKTIIGGPNIDLKPNLQIFYLTIMMGALNTVRESVIKRLRLTPPDRVYRPYIWIVEQNPENAEYDFQAMLEDAKKLFSKPRSISVDALATYTGEDTDSPFTLASIYPFTGR